MSADKAGSTDDLEQLSGVGPATAETLAEEGYDSFEAILDVSVDELASVVDRWGVDQAKQAHADAIEAVSVEEHSTTDTAGDSDAEVLLSTNVQRDDDATPVSLPDNQPYYLLDVVLEEATRQKARGNRELRNDALDVASALITDMATARDDDTPVQFRLPATESHLQALSRATGQGFRDYQRESVGGDIVPKIRTVRERAMELRN